MSAAAPIVAIPKSDVRPNSIGAWLLASRPKTLSAAAVPVLVGTACASARGAVKWGPALAALAGALLLQIGANFANDVFDFEKGADTSERLGPTRAVQAGLLSAQSMRRGMWLVFALAVLVGLYLTFVSGPVILLIGCASIASAIAYTGGPYPLGYHGLGDVFVFIFFWFGRRVRHRARRARPNTAALAGVRRPGRRAGNGDLGRKQLARSRHRSRGRQAHVGRALRARFRAQSISRAARRELPDSSSLGSHGQRGTGGVDHAALAAARTQDRARGHGYRRPRTQSAARGDRQAAGRVRHLVRAGPEHA